MDPRPIRRDTPPDEIARRFPRGVARHEPTQGISNYQIQYYASWAVVVTLAFTGAIQLAGPDDLGISPVVFRWVGIIASALGVLQGFLPSLRRPPVAHDDSGPVGDVDPMPRDK